MLAVGSPAQLSSVSPTSCPLPRLLFLRKLDAHHGLEAAVCSYPRLLQAFPVDSSD